MFVFLFVRLVYILGVTLGIVQLCSLNGIRVDMGNLMHSLFLFLNTRFLNTETGWVERCEQ